MSSNRIQILPDLVINQIAAGEVIERPGSIVKELVENSLDAEASHLQVELQDGGTKYIRVTDNGMGMPPQDAKLCFERHATSKLQTLADLFRIQTLGFRGEAIPSIAAVSHMKLTTQASQASMGICLEVEGGKFVRMASMARASGTEIEVSQLFYNVPARKKFLKTMSTELGSCLEAVVSLALSHPKVTFSVKHQDREILFYPKVSSVEERILSVFNEEEGHFIKVDRADGTWRIFGMVSLAHVMNHHAKDCLYYVNQRPIRDRTVQHAVLSAYQNLMPAKCYPKVVLFLEHTGEEVDVNVHPSKREVRFKDVRWIHRFLEHTIREALESSSEKLQPFYSVPVAMIHEPMQAGSEKKEVIPRDYSGTSQREVLRDERLSLFEKKVFPSNAELFEEAHKPGRNFSYLGQLKNSYLVCSDDKDLIVIDQHAAHERILFEKIKKSYETKIGRTQALLLPIQIDVSPNRAQVYEEAISILKEIGFELETFGPQTLILKGISELFKNKASSAWLRSILEELRELPTSLHSLQRLDKVLATVACHAARTAHEKLTHEEAIALVQSVSVLETAYHCPHGRPFSHRMPISEIEKKFHRA
ncbi:MAG: DNA mismatch repair endonuclease MutL [Deltaproteobacteria bacterium]|nr:DNA mismatch repair endonuclease MutL [Deltaproteobacteria bacterium]